MMNLIRLLSLFCLVISSQAPFGAQRPIHPSGFHALAPDANYQAILNQVNPETLRLYTRQLSGLEAVSVDDSWYTIPSRYTYSGTAIEKTTRFVGQHLQSLGQTVDYHIWDASTNPNVIGEIRGLNQPEDIYIIGGHLDALEGVPGADDNGSGAAATLLMADLLSKYQWGCTIRFAFWTGEEQWILGSTAYAQRSKTRSEKILGYLNLDMVGYNSPGSSPGVDVIYNANLPQTVDLAQTFVDVANAYQLQIVPEMMSDLSADSDHYSFWQNGFPAILAIEDQADWNPYYHSPQDTADQIDLGYLTEVAKASLATFLHTNNCLLPSATGTATAVPPTPTQTATPLPPTWTYTPTPLPPTPTDTATAVPPTPTQTATPLPPTSTYTPTPLPPTPTDTPTAVPPTPTQTATPLPPTSSYTPTSTVTLDPSPTATSTPTRFFIYLPVIRNLIPTQLDLQYIGNAQRRLYLLKLVGLVK